MIASQAEAGQTPNTPINKNTNNNIYAALVNILNNCQKYYIINKSNLNTSEQKEENKDSIKPPPCPPLSSTQGGS